MSLCMKGGALALLAVSTIAIAASRAAEAALGNGTAMPYELAFDAGRLPHSGVFEVSADGKRFAYVVLRFSLDQVEAARKDSFERTGTPHTVAGSRIYVTDLQDRRTIEVCPGGERSQWLPSWSPDGRRLAFYSDADGKARLWIYDLSSQQCRRVGDAAIKSLPYVYIDNEAKWSADGKTLFVPVAAQDATAPAIVDKQQARVLVYRSGSERASEDKKGAAAPAQRWIGQAVTIAAVALDTGETRILARSTDQPRPNLLRVSASGRWVSFLSMPQLKDPTSHRQSVDLAVVSADGGPAQIVGTDLAQLSILTNPRLTYSWHPTEDRLVYIKDGAIWLVDLRSGRAGRPRRLAPELGELEPTVQWFTRDGRSVVVGIEPRFENEDSRIFPGEPRGLAIVALDGRATRKISFNDPNWVYDDILKADTRTVWQPDGKSLTVRMRGRTSAQSAIVRFDLATGKSKVLWQGLAEIGGRAGTWAAGGNHDFIAGTYEDYTTPKNIYRFDADFTSKERVSNIEPRFDALELGKAEVFETTVPSYDGKLEKIRSTVLLPPGAKRGDRLPAIVLFYPQMDLAPFAGRFGGDISMVEPPLLFTSRGYAVLLAHVKIGPEGVAGNPAKEMTDVLLPQIYRAAELGYIDVGRLALRGQSFGGYGTAAIVSQTNLFRAAVPSNGPYDFFADYRSLDSEGYPNAAYYEHGQGRMGEHPWANLRRYIDNSPAYQADKIFTPMLLIQGGDDGFADDAKKLFGALRRLDKPAQLAIYAGEGHAVPLWSIANAVDASQRMLEFYRKYLGASE